MFEVCNCFNGSLNEATTKIFFARDGRTRKYTTRGVNEAIRNVFYENDEIRNFRVATSCKTKIAIVKSKIAKFGSGVRHKTMSTFRSQCIFAPCIFSNAVTILHMHIHLICPRYLYKQTRNLKSTTHLIV